MMARSILQNIDTAHREGRKQLALLIDPDTLGRKPLDKLLQHAERAGVDYFLVGGSLLLRDRLDECIDQIRAASNRPVILFPGGAHQISARADAILFLSLISGRNPELLIGTQVIAAPLVRQAGLETLPTGYMLVESGQPTTASYMSGSAPIPHNKPEIAACTALAGEMLGLRLMYLDGGSGAQQSVSPEMIRQVRQAVSTPIIVGGGIRDENTARELCRAGADILVVGHASESNPSIIESLARTIHQHEKV